MAETITNLCGKLSLMDDEATKVVIDKDWIEGGVENEWLCLIGKAYSPKSLNLNGMRTAFCNAWNLSKNPVVREMVFVFQIEDELERDIVLVSQPWSFSKDLIVLKEYDRLRVDNLNLRRAKFNGDEASKAGSIRILGVSQSSSRQLVFWVGGNHCEANQMSLAQPVKRGGAVGQWSR
ncbi:hypothetical protein COLO4_25208 [Corchorus olitorius]|uniref:DUF4283 domain-containing protein n=1 Tax=Corchorus olitorius TaxID=93759 RepID=A0A1R3I472_9ROSI|nr:hypothetical protein COLO4_25208 [Corchorus olitorius]